MGSDNSPLKATAGSYFVPLMLSMIGVLIATIALVFYHFILVRLWLKWRLRAGGGEMALHTSQEVPQGPIGVDQKLLDTIPIVAYSTREEYDDDNFFRKDQTECVVCLGELEDGEMVRLLPNCKHAFHVPCIDEWFVAHISCPICRCPIVAEEDPPPPGVENDVPTPQPSSPLTVALPTSGLHGSGVFSTENHDQPWTGIIITANNDASLSDSGANKQRFARILSIGSSVLPSQRASSSPRGIAGLRRSLSLDYSSVVINIHQLRDGRRDGSSSSSYFTAKDDLVESRTPGSLSVKHLDRVSSKLRMSLSRLRGKNSDISLPY